MTSQGPESHEALHAAHRSIGWFKDVLGRGFVLWVDLVCCGGGTLSMRFYAGFMLQFCLRKAAVFMKLLINRVLV